MCDCDGDQDGVVDGSHDGGNVGSGRSIRYRTWCGNVSRNQCDAPIKRRISINSNISAISAKLVAQGAAMTQHLPGGSSNTAGAMAGPKCHHWAFGDY